MRVSLGVSDAPWHTSSVGPSIKGLHNPSRSGAVKDDLELFYIRTTTASTYFSLRRSDCQ